MRRHLVLCIAGFVCLLCAPSRADAYFWHWLDDLSGPQFKGWTLEWRVVCSSQNELQRLSNEIRGLSSALGTGSTAEAAIRAARTANALAVSAVSGAVAGADTLPSPVLDRLVREALSQQQIAILQLGDAVPDTSLLASASLADSGTRDRRSDFLPPVGLAQSLCRAKRYDRRTSALTASVAWGRDRKNDDNRMVSAGASFHTTLHPSLEVGAGAGVAWFSSSVTDTTERLYIEPYKIDWRPAAMVKNAAFSSAWRHAFFVRYSTITFPQGFEPGAFGPDSPRYPAELVHQVGLYADLEPLVRKWRGRW